jgi:hypothetical protein
MGWDERFADGGREDERKNLKQLDRDIGRPAIAEKWRSLIPNGDVRYRLVTPYGDRRRMSSSKRWI